MSPGAPFEIILPFFSYTKNSLCLLFHRRWTPKGTCKTWLELAITFLPAAKPAGHGTVRVVGGDYFEVTTLKVDVRSRSTNFGLLSSLHLPPLRDFVYV